MDTVDLKKLVSSPDGIFASGVAVSGQGLAVMAWTLGPRLRMPELEFTRSDVVYLVLEGVMRVLSGDDTAAVSAGEVLSLPRGVRHRVQNETAGPMRVAVIRAPGPARVEDLGVGRVECPVCAGSVPLEKGDRPRDRFVCVDCGYVMTLGDHEGLLRPVPFVPEPCDVRE